MGTTCRQNQLLSISSSEVGSCILMVIMKLFAFALVLFCLVSQHLAEGGKRGTMPPDPASITCGGKVHFVGNEIPNGEDSQTTMGKKTVCECADWCKSLGNGYVHVGTFLTNSSVTVTEVWRR